MKPALVTLLFVTACSRAQPAKPEARDNELDRFNAMIVGLVDKVPAATPPPVTKQCPATIKGNLVLLDYELALRIRNKTGLPQNLFIDHDETIYDLVKYAAGQPTKPDAHQRAAQLASKSPAFLRISEMAVPAQVDGKPVDGKLSAAIYVLDKGGTVACQVAFNLRSVEDGAKPETAAQFGATATSAILQVLQEL